MEDFVYWLLVSLAGWGWFIIMNLYSWLAPALDKAGKYAGVLFWGIAILLFGGIPWSVDAWGYRPLHSDFVIAANLVAMGIVAGLGWLALRRQSGS
jgi:hypothetical protein